MIVLPGNSAAKDVSRHESCCGFAAGRGEFSPESRPRASNDGFEMKERVPSFVPWIAVVVAALTIVVFFVGSPTSHTRRSLCVAFASIYAEHCPGHSVR